MELSEKLYKNIVSDMLMLEHGDTMFDFDSSEHNDNTELVMNYPNLINYIKQELIDYIDHETDVTKLMALLKQTMHKNISKYGKKYRISKQKADSMIESLVEQANRQKV